MNASTDTPHGCSWLDATGIWIQYYQDARIQPPLVRHGTQTHKFVPARSERSEQASRTCAGLTEWFEIKAGVYLAQTRTPVLLVVERACKKEDLMASSRLSGQLRTEREQLKTDSKGSLCRQRTYYAQYYAFVRKNTTGYGLVDNLVKKKKS